MSSLAALHVIVRPCCPEFSGPRPPSTFPFSETALIAAHAFRSFSRTRCSLSCTDDLHRTHAARQRCLPPSTTPHYSSAVMPKRKRNDPAVQQDQQKQNSLLPQVRPRRCLYSPPLPATRRRTHPSRTETPLQAARARQPVLRSCAELPRVAGCYGLGRPLSRFRRLRQDPRVCRHRLWLWRSAHRPRASLSRHLDPR